MKSLRVELIFTREYFDIVIANNDRGEWAVDEGEHLGHHNSINDLNDKLNEMLDRAKVTDRFE